MSVPLIYLVGFPLCWSPCAGALNISSRGLPYVGPLVLIPLIYLLDIYQVEISINPYD